jgi:oligopeptidase B
MESSTPTAPTTAPVAKTVPSERTFHGRTVADPYEWLRDKENPEVREYLEAENSWTAAHTTGLADLEHDIFEEVRARVQETDMSVPVRSGDWWYFSRTQEGKSYATMCRRPVDAGDAASSWTPPEIDPTDAPGTPDGEEVMLDCNALAEGRDFFSLGAASVTLDGRFLAYSVDELGDERYTLVVKDLTTGDLLDDRITDISAGATWVGDDHLFYQRVDEAWRPHEVWRHRIGTPVDDDVCVFREEDEHYWVGVGVTRSERFLIVSSASKTTSETWYLDLGDGTDPTAAEGALTCIRPREQGVQYDVDHVVVDGRDWWLVLHDSLAERPNGELGRCPVGPIFALDDLEVMVAHRDDRRIEGVDCFADHIVLATRDNAIEKLALMMLPATETGHGWGTFEPVTFDEELYSAGTTGNSEWESPVLRVAYTSYVTPSQVWEIDLASGERTLRREQTVLGDFDRTRYTASRRWVTAADGARIPVSLIHRADVPLYDVDGGNPVLLYGYGSYEACMDPYFSVFRLSMLDRGVVYAVAHVRGGGEMGRAWYEQGKELNKRNTFTDFIAVADDLIAAGLTTPQKMVAEGGSAGGLLMGAVANMAPDRFAGIEAVVPVRRPADLDPQAGTAADGHRVGGVGRSVPRSGGLRLHGGLRTVRERHGPGVSADPGDQRVQRHPRAVRGAGEVDREAAGDGCAGVGGVPAEDRHVLGSRRGLRTLRPVAPVRVRDRLGARPDGGPGAGLTTVQTCSAPPDSRSAAPKYPPHAGMVRGAATGCGGSPE